MINIKVICVGKLSESYLKQAQSEYLKRLNKYCKIEIIELNDTKVPQGNISDIQKEQIKQKECDEILKRLDKLTSNGRYSIFTLDLKGKEYNSIELSNLIDDTSKYISSTIIFIIGGTLGLTDEVISKSQKLICFSKLTFPHQLIRIFLLEQIFRCFKILNNETYHH